MTLMAGLTIAAGMPPAAGAENSPAAAGDRTQILLNFDWKFHLGDIPRAQEPNFPDRDWKSVNLPHDWSVFGPFDKDAEKGASYGFLPRGIGWYRKAFPSPESGKRVVLDFGGVYSAADVWLNGTHLGKNYNGYLGFRYDVTDLLKPAGELNSLAVRADNSRLDSSRWYTGSGIYRDVNLIITDRVYIPIYSTWITTPKIAQDKAEVHVETVLTNSSSQAHDVTLTTNIYDPAGKLAATGNKSEHLTPGTSVTVKQDMVVAGPQLWSPETPYLYNSVSRMVADQRPCDLLETRFGIRTIEFTPEQGLLLNGKKVIVKGTNIHHDLGCLGAAAFDRGFERRLELIKAMGCNAVRLAHNPYQPSLLDMCDRMGILVFDEAYDKWSDQYTGPERPFKTAWPEDLRTFILRDRNHPSVFLWSLGNEQVNHQTTPPDFGVNQFKAMQALVKSLDPTRAVTCALFPVRGTGIRFNAKPKELFENSEPAEMSFAMDVVSCNYTEAFFARDHLKYPKLIFLLSEARTNGSGGDSWFNFDHAYTVGLFYWGGFDYIGESFKWPCKGWFRGFIDLAGFRKPGSYYVESLFSDKPMVHIAIQDAKPPSNVVWNDVKLNWEYLVSHWNWTPGQTLKVFTYSNGDTVELFLNNRSLGTQKMGSLKDLKMPWQAPFDTPQWASAPPTEGLKMSWEVPFAPGTLKAVAYKDGRVIAEDQIQTAGPATRLVLESDRPALKADGLDLAHITVRVVDDNGIMVPDAKQLVHFSVTGNGTNAGVDNGDMYSGESWQMNARSVYQGRALLVVRAGRKDGSVQIQANAEGLKPATLELPVRSSGAK